MTKAKNRNFEVGDQVFVFHKLINEWKGPITIVRKLTDVTYEVTAGQGPRSLRVYHVNGMKAWHSPVPSALVATECTTTLDPGPTIEEGTNLTTQQQNDLDNLVEEYRDVFSDTPGRMEVVEHVINTGDASPIRLAPIGSLTVHTNLYEMKSKRCFDKAKSFLHAAPGPPQSCWCPRQMAPGAYASITES